MYILQVKQPTETWIAALSQHKEYTTEYIATLPAEIQAVAFLYEVPITYYPFIIIENIHEAHDSDSYFEFCDFERLQNRIGDARKNKAASEDHIYFKYYYITQPYSQMVTDENYMKYLRHTAVTNYVLNQPYPVSFFHEEVKKNAAEYNIDHLDQLFEHTKTTYPSALEKEDLALNGYENLFWEMNYDHACGKLTDLGKNLLLPMVDKMEILLDEKKWKHRSYALHILLEEACKEEPQKALELLKDTVDSFDQYLISEPEEPLEIHRLISLAYRWMIKTNSETAFHFWKLAITEIEKAIDYNPEKASWFSVLELIHTPYVEHPEITVAQIETQNVFHDKALHLEKLKGEVISYSLALAYQQVEEHLTWQKIEASFLEAKLLFWSEKAIAYNPKKASRIDVHECATFFNKLGLQSNRVNFLVKTISLYERVLNAKTDCALEVYYITNVLKQIAEIHIENQQPLLADEAIIQAQVLYKKHLELIKQMPSGNTHYAEFLEYCYNYSGAITKPTVAELRNIAEEIEIESEGHYSYPYNLLMRVALLENNQNQAIIECTKTLILHELCADSSFKKLEEEVKDSNFNTLKSFLQETNKFMKEVDTNYYYDPQLRWNNIRTMSDEELLTYWEKRKEEIRNRPSA